MAVSLTYADVFRPSDKKTAGIYDAILIVAGSLAIGLSAQMAVRLPFSPVPVTGQTFAVLMMGTLLGARRGSLCVIAYIAEGLAGMPVFAMGGGGPAVLLGPTGGYLIGFVGAAYVTGALAQMGWDRQIGTTILAMIAGDIVLYAFGLFWLCCLMGVNKVVVIVGLYPFIAGDVLKIILAAAVLPAGWKMIRKKC